MAYSDKQSTPSSQCFRKIAFYSDRKRSRGILGVQFKRDGSTYFYDSFKYNDWNDFKDANSKGRYYNDNIKE